MKTGSKHNQARMSSESVEPERGSAVRTSMTGRLEDTGSGAKPVEVSALEGGRILETWDDLLDLSPKERVLVPMPAELGEAVWVWHNSLELDNPAGKIGRGVRDLLLGLSAHDTERIVEGVGAVLLGFLELRGWGAKWTR